MTADGVRTSSRRRAVELAVLFTVGPGLLALGPRWLVTVGILASGVGCGVALALDPTFPRRELLDVAAVRKGIGFVLGRTLIVWVALVIVAILTTPDPLFVFPRRAPALWGAVMVLYPLSAYAQEIVFRTFFFHRYASLFRRPGAVVVASGLVFGWAHIVVNNLPAVGLSALAGLLFASTYHRSRSTLLVSIEHALYGDFVFTVGLGSLFYSPARWLTY
jgi:membrane protease YdiL (CAAX protease family)